MKLVPNAIVVSVFLLSSVGSIRAHSGDRVYAITELTDDDIAAIDLHDVSVEDWRATLGEPTLVISDFIRRSREPYDPSDLDFRIWLGWHDATDRIYAAMERVDDVYTNDYVWNDFFMWLYDSAMLLSIDGDHSGGQYKFPPIEFSTEKERRLNHHQQAQRFSAISETFDGTQSVREPEKDQWQDGWYSRPPYADGGGGTFSESPTVSVTEFFITPFDRLLHDSESESVVSDLSPGKIVGFNIEVRDPDEMAQSHETIFQLTLSGTGLTATWVDGVLVSANREVTQSTAVGSQTWGQIKASFAE